MLYHWNQVEYLCQYSSGDIIVEADSLFAARVLAEAHALQHIDGDDGRWYGDQEERTKQWATILADIAKEPMIVESGVVFVRGSD